MGKFIYGGRFCFYLPSSGDSQPRRDALEAQLLIRRTRGMEEGARVRPEPPPPNAAAWKYFKICCRCSMAAMSIGLIAYIFVARHLNLDPYMQDPYKMATLLIISLAPVGFGYMITQGDIETQDSQAQEEAQL